MLLQKTVEQSLLVFTKSVPVKPGTSPPCLLFAVGARCIVPAVKQRLDHERCRGVLHTPKKTKDNKTGRAKFIVPLQNHKNNE